MWARERERERAAFGKERERWERDRMKERGEWEREMKRGSDDYATHVLELQQVLTKEREAREQER